MSATVSKISKKVVSKKRAVSKKKPVAKKATAKKVAVKKPTDSEVKPEDVPEIIRGDRQLAALAGGRSRMSIREWCERGMPFSKCPDDGRTSVFEVAECIKWCKARGLNFFDKDGIQLTPIQQEKYQQELYKAKDLARKDAIAENKFASVEDFEAAQEVLLRELKMLMIDVVGKIKKSAKLKGKKAEAIDAELISGFNKIADLKLTK